MSTKHEARSSLAHEDDTTKECSDGELVARSQKVEAPEAFHKELLTLELSCEPVAKSQGPPTKSGPRSLVFQTSLVRKKTLVVVTCEEEDSGKRPKSCLKREGAFYHVYPHAKQNTNALRPAAECEMDTLVGRMISLKLQ